MWWLIDLKPIINIPCSESESSIQRAQIINSLSIRVAQSARTKMRGLARESLLQALYIDLESFNKIIDSSCSHGVNPPKLSKQARHVSQLARKFTQATLQLKMVSHCSSSIVLLVIPRSQSQKVICQNVLWLAREAVLQAQYMQRAICYNAAVICHRDMLKAANLWGMLHSKLR